MTEEQILVAKSRHHDLNSELSLGKLYGDYADELSCSMFASATVQFLLPPQIPDSLLFALGFIVIDWNIAPCCIRRMLPRRPPIRMRTIRGSSNITNWRGKLLFFQFKNGNSSWLHKAEESVFPPFGFFSLLLVHFADWCCCCMCSETTSEPKNLKMLIFLKSHWGPQFKCGPIVYTLIYLLNGHHSDQHPSIHLQSKRAYYMKTYPESVTQVLPCQQQPQQLWWRLPKALKMFSGDTETLAEPKPRWWDPGSPLSPSCRARFF